MLSNYDIDVLVEKMGINNFKGCFYKDKLKKIQPNSSYILNLNSELDENGNRTNGSHWTCLVTGDMKRAIYHDSYGEAPSNEIRNLSKSKDKRFTELKKAINIILRTAIFHTIQNIQI